MMRVHFFDGENKIEPITLTYAKLSNILLAADIFDIRLSYL